MKLCYQVATPDVAVSPAVTALQGSLNYTFGTLKNLGYDGVELMTLNPGKLNWQEVKDTASKNNLDVVLVCTGEIFGQLGLSFVDPKESVREEAVERVKEIIDFAGYLNANINIGRVRGQYCPEVSKKQTYSWAVEAFHTISTYAQAKNVTVALESVTIMQTNFINTLQEAVQMVKDVDHPNFRIMMDIFHMNLEEKDLIQAIHDYSAWNAHVHLADNNRRYPGQCGLDFEKIMQAFHKNGYQGAFCTEIMQLPDQETAAAQSIAHLKPILSKVYGS